MIGAILATDMAKHQQMIRDLSQHAAERTVDIPPSFSLEVICHVADLCNCAIDWDLSRVWARRVCDEATAQAQRELAFGLQVDKSTPYTDEELFTRQLVFLDVFVRPLFKAAAILYPGARNRLNAIASCREGCKGGLRALGKTIQDDKPEDRGVSTVPRRTQQPSATSVSTQQDAKA